MFGVDDAISGVTGLLGKVIDKVFPDPAQAAQAKVLLMQQELQPDLEQIKINVQEASSTSAFVAGWRPFIGWVCGFAFAYKFLILPFAVFITLQFNPLFDVKALPAIEWPELSSIMLGMLGLSYHRTKEKLAN